MTSNKRWYSEGLRFGCTGCGACCRGDGYVWVTPQEVDALAQHLSLAPNEFGRRYLRRVGARLALVDGQDDACVFWDGSCRVYALRPTQCRTFPFWSRHLATPKAWEKAALESPGIDRGRLYDRAEIEALLAGGGAAENLAQSTEDGEESR